MRYLLLLVALVVPLCFGQSEPAQPPVDKQAVTVTGTWEPVPLDELDRSVAVIEPDHNELYRTWADLLQSDSSLDLRQRGTNTVQGDLSIRGSSFGQTLILVNGLRFNDVQSGHHNLNVPLPLESIDRIEVLRGSGSTLYGSDAIGGAVNFITAPPSASELTLGAAIGNFGVNTQHASLAYSGQRLSQRVSAVRDFSSGFMPNRDYRVLSAASDTSVKTGLGFTHLLVAAADRPFGAQNFYGRYNSWERTKTWFASVRQQMGTRVEAAFAYRRNTDDFILRRDRPTAYQNHHKTNEWQAALRWREPLRSNLTLFTGAEAFRESIDSTNLRRHARNRGAAYINLDARALRRFSLSLGTREEFYGTRGQLSPTVSGGVWIASGLKLRASAGRAFRLPSYTDLYYSDPANRGNPNLRPESAWTYEGGLQWTRGRLHTDATVFHRRERDVIDYVRYSPTDLWQATNFQRLNFTGLETSAGVSLNPRHSVRASYTALRGAHDALTGALAGASSKYVFNYPVHNAVLSWEGLLPGAIIARSRVGVTQRFSRDAYSLWDAALSRQFEFVRARVNFTNITSTAYEEIPLVAMPGRAVVLGLDFVWSKR